MREPVKRKRGAPPEAPNEAALGEEPDAAFAQWLKQEEQMAEAV